VVAAVDDLRNQLERLMDEEETPIPPEAMQKLMMRENDTGDMRPQYIKRADGTTEDFLTAGFGHKLPKDTDYKKGDPISPEQAQEWLEADSKKAWKAAQSQAEEMGVPGMAATLLPVNFQLGTSWNKEHKNTWKALKAGDMELAADEALNRSKWAKQTPDRVMDFVEGIMPAPEVIAATEQPPRLPEDEEQRMLAQLMRQQEGPLGS
jgi:hypothetical protein